MVDVDPNLIKSPLPLPSVVVDTSTKRRCGTSNLIKSSSNVATVTSPPDPAVDELALISTVPLDALFVIATTSLPGNN